MLEADRLGHQWWSKHTRSDRSRATARVKRINNPLAGSVGRGDRRNNVVSPATLLIVADDEGGRVVGGAVHDGLDDVALKPGTIDRHVGSMLTLLLRANDPADLREGTTGTSIIEGIQTRERDALVTKGLAVGRLLVLLEVSQHVVLKVVKVLPNAPRDTSILQVLRSGLPDKREAVVARRVTAGTGTVRENVTAAAVGVCGRALGVDGTAHPNNTVGVSDTEDALVRVVHDGPALGDIPVGRNILAFVVAHGVVRVMGDPAITAAVVVCAVHGLPAVGTTTHTLSGIRPVAAEVVNVPRRQGFGAILGTSNGS